MTPPLSSEDLDRLARKRAGAKLGWYVHASVYLVVNAVLFFLASQGVGHRQWTIYPALGWGIGLLLHGVSVFLIGSGAGLRESMEKRERDRLQRKQDRR
ncbi:MAG: 2TM domain-containing protein [Burkholderiaceae bacterium]|nr:2TM domain-containing protein [Burkholderiaceae bacterium]